jgi:tRNA(Ile)-lysidine synthase
LLHATLLAAVPLGVEVLALHVHHGLHAEADEWLEHCRRWCRRRARGGAPLRFAARRLQAAPPAGESVEAWARGQRYRALAAMAHEHHAALVLLAHHRRDQAETFLLQALRGGGVAGIAGMRVRDERDGLVWLRPWLQRARDEIEAYVRRHRLSYIDDVSNADARYARNRLRMQVWPVLIAAFEGAEGGLADTARWAAHAKQVLDEIASADLSRLDRSGAIDVYAWRELSPSRRRNALLSWLRQFSAATASLIERLMRELPTARSGARWPVDAAAELRLYRGLLRFDKRASDRPAQSEELKVEGPGIYAVPRCGGRLIVRRVQRGGVGAGVLRALRATPRSGRETFQLSPRATPRSLKKQFQRLGIPQWERDGPLLFADDRLVFVAGLGIDARVRAAADEPQFSLRWVRDR